MNVKNDLDNANVRQHIADQLEKMSSLLDELAEHFGYAESVSPELSEAEHWRERRATVANAARQLRYAAREVRP